MAPASWVHHHHHPPPPPPTVVRNYHPGYYNRHIHGNKTLANVIANWDMPGVSPSTPIRGGQTGEAGYFQGSMIPYFWNEIEPGPTPGNPVTGVGYNAATIADMKTYTAAAAAAGLRMVFMIENRSYSSDGGANCCPSYMLDGQTTAGGVAPINFNWTANPAAGATSATLTANWTHASGSWLTQFTEVAAPHNTEEVMVTFTNGSTAATWTGGLTKQCQSGGSWVSLAISVPNSAGGFSGIVWDQSLYVPSWNNLMQYLSTQFDSDPGLEGFSCQETALGETNNVIANQAYGPYSATRLVNAYNLMLTSQSASFDQGRVFLGFNFLLGGQGITSPCLGDILTVCSSLDVSAGGPDCLPTSVSLTPPPPGAAYHWYDTLINGGFFGGPGPAPTTGGVKLTVQISPPSYQTPTYDEIALYNFMKNTAGPLSNSLHVNYCFAYLENGAGQVFTWNDWINNVANVTQYIELP